MPLKDRENWGVMNTLFSSDPCFFRKKYAPWDSCVRGIRKNRIMPLFDQGTVCAKTPPEYLASGKILFSRRLKEIWHFAEYPPGPSSLQGCSVHNLSFEQKQYERRSFCSMKINGL